MFLHYTELSKTGADITLYNVPGRTGVDLLPKTVLKLIEIENITGIKEAVNNPDRFKDLLKNESNETRIFVVIWR